MIQLKCTNSTCGFSYSVSDKEFLEYGKHYHNKCMICGSKLEISNIKEIIAKSIYDKAKQNIQDWFQKIGIESTIELVERYKNNCCYRIYKEILEQKGFKLKEE